MKTVNISDAKNNLSRHLEYVRRGGRLRIMDRNTPVAELIPVEPSGGEGDDEALIVALERRGLARRGKGGPVPADLLRPGPRGPKAGVLEALLAERAESR